MKSAGQGTTVQVDSYTRLCLTAITVLLTVLIIGLWADRPGPASDAGAQERYQPRSGLDITQLVDIQKQTNVRLDKLIGLFQSGKAKVHVVSGPAPATTVTTPGGNGNVSEEPEKPAIRIYAD